MLEEQVAYFIMVMIALLLLLTVLTGSNSYGSIVSNMSQTRTIFTMVSADDEGSAGEIGVQQIGEFYDYTLRIVPTIQVNPEPKEDVAIVAVVGFKDKYAGPIGFSLRTGEKTIQPQIEASVTSPYPPLSEGSQGTNTFTVGREYVIHSESGGSFKVGMIKIEQKYSIFDPLKLPECASSFVAQCKNSVQYANDLFVCREGSDKKCSAKLDFSTFAAFMPGSCAGSITITLTGPDTRVCETAEADIVVDGGDADWQAMETATISFFRVSECTELIKDVALWISSCQSDFLGSYRANFNYANA